MSTKTALLALPASAVTAHRDAMAEARAAGPEALTAGIGYYKAGAVAVVPVAGMLTHSLHAPAFGVMGYGAIRQALTAALEDQSTSAVLLHINSNGGEVQGLFALADHIRAARGGKPIVALVDETALSAGYALAAASDKIVLASGTSVAGSVGIVAAHWDLSGAEAQAGVKVTLVAAGAHKTDGNPHEPLSAEACGNRGRCERPAQRVCAAGRFMAQPYPCASERPRGRDLPRPSRDKRADGRCNRGPRSAGRSTSNPRWRLRHDPSEFGRAHCGRRRRRSNGRRRPHPTVQRPASARDCAYGRLQRGADP